MNLNKTGDEVVIVTPDGQEHSTYHHGDGRYSTFILCDRCGYPLLFIDISNGSVWMQITEEQATAIKQAREGKFTRTMTFTGISEVSERQGTPEIACMDEGWALMVVKPTAKFAWNEPPVILLAWRDDELSYLGGCQEKDREQRLEAVKKLTDKFEAGGEIRAIHMNDIKTEVRQWLQEKGQSKDQISDHLMRLGQTMAMV